MDSSPLSKKDLETQVMLAARDQGISSVLFRNAMGRKLGLNVADSECLSFLTLKGVATPSELARHTGLSSGATTALLDRLEKVGFIQRKANPEDRRGVLVETTQRYAEMSKPLVVGVQAAHRELLASYSEEELEVIADFLTRFAQNVKEATKEITKAG